MLSRICKVLLESSFDPDGEDLPPLACPLDKYP